MCEEMLVTLPMVGSFLLLYSLKCGSLVIVIWTVIRSLFCLFFFIIMLLEAFVKKNSPFGFPLFIHVSEATNEANALFVYYCSIMMIIAEAFLFLYCYYLVVGLHCESYNPISEYLICRFITWLLEATNVFVLIIVHKLLIGWYLGMLLFVILEFYGFIVVYSYYMELREEEDSHECKP